jgi:hypothetical protein
MFFASSCETVKEYQKNRLNDSEMALTARKVEKNELNFYLQEYIGSSSNKINTKGKPIFFSKDAGKRWRSLYANGASTGMYVDPVMSATVVEGDHQTYTSTSSGLHFWGNVGKHIGFQFFYNDSFQNNFSKYLYLS